MLLLALFACGDLSSGEIVSLLEANTRVVANIEARSETIETKLRHGQGDGDYTYEGVLEADGAWDAGAIAVSGSGSSSQGGTLLFYSFELDYDQVEVDGLVMDGPVDASIGVTIADGSVSVLYTVKGDLELSGDASGTASMDWSMNASSSVDQGQPRYGGTVNGRDVARIMD